MARKNATEQWHDRLENSSVPMRKVGAGGKLLGFASCCLGDYRCERLLLSVAHQVLSPKAKQSELGDWAIYSGRQPKKDFYWVPTEMKYLCRVELSTLQVDYVDLAYTVLPKKVGAYSQRFNDYTGEVIWQKPKTVHRLNFDLRPRRGVYYGFAGHTAHTVADHPRSSIFSYEIVVVDDLPYIDTHNDMHIFKLGAKHPGHGRFEGCSGAPIISKNGEVVALVCAGEIEGDLIYGIALSAYKAAVDFEVAGPLAPGDPRPTRLTRGR